MTDRQAAGGGLGRSTSRQVVEAERAAVKYLKYEAFAGAERLPCQGRDGEPRGIGGIPFTTVQVKYRQDRSQIQSWITTLLDQRKADGNQFCLLVVRIEGESPGSWEAHLPPMWDLDYANEPLPEAEAWTWSRMDLRLAVSHLSSAIRIWGWARTYELSTGAKPTLNDLRAWIREPRST